MMVFLKQVPGMQQLDSVSITIHPTAHRSFRVRMSTKHLSKTHRQIGILTTMVSVNIDIRPFPLYPLDPYRYSLVSNHILVLSYLSLGHLFHFITTSPRVNQHSRGVKVT